MSGDHLGRVHLGVVTPAADDAEHGRGLTLVYALCAPWGSYWPHGGSGEKVVWALLTSAPDQAAAAVFASGIEAPVRGIASKAAVGLVAK